MRQGLLTLALLAFPLALLAEPPPETQKPPQPALEKLIEDLGSPSYATREGASRALGEAGEGAREALEKALHSKDPEVQNRARTLLESLEARRREKTGGQRKEKEEEDDEGLADPLLTLQKEVLKELNLQMPMVRIVQGPANVQVAMNLNGKRIQLDQDDLALLEALKGRKVAGGVRCSACPEELAAHLKITGGILVRACEEACLRLEKHDVIVAAAGAEVSDPDALGKLLESSAGKPLELMVYRKGEKKTLTVTPPKP